jgi:hypothetical protein
VSRPQILITTPRWLTSVAPWQMMAPVSACSGSSKEVGDVLAVEFSHRCTRANFTWVIKRQEDDALFHATRTPAHFGGVDDAVSNVGAEGSPLPHVRTGGVPVGSIRIRKVS